MMDGGRIPVAQPPSRDNWFNSAVLIALPVSHSTLHGVVFAILCLGPAMYRYGHAGRLRL
jgi:hypothetical protein